MTKLLTVTIAALWLALPRAAAACATCYGAADSPMTKGMNNGILTLIALVGVVYVGIGKMFLDFRRRSRKLNEKAMVRQRLRLIHGEKR
ncbi:MAG TPA: hypothetical protein VF173_07205 [Thermoanaerobaculia bacterium]|nr:hypothetical protein [Thermoanaerobaculia bacterium]